ncbi:MAG: UvrB/UvrC motif-containing protein [Solirubrobacterales bacterium]
MYCQECKSRPAAVHLTQVHDGIQSEYHLCTDCAAKKGIAFFNMEDAFSIPKFLGSFFGIGSGQGAPEASLTEEIRCPNCGMAFDQIGQQGRFGCSDCYTAFQEQIDPILRRIHGNSQHTGKIPQHGGGKYRGRRQIEDLKQQLQAAVVEEQYEKAAELRDSIKLLEKELEVG